MGQASSRNLYVVNVVDGNGDDVRPSRKMRGHTASPSEDGRVSNPNSNGSILQQQEHHPQQEDYQQHVAESECISATKNDPTQPDTAQDVGRRRLGKGVSWYVHDYRPPLTLARPYD